MKEGLLKREAGGAEGSFFHQLPMEGAQDQPSMSRYISTSGSVLSFILPAPFFGFPWPKNTLTIRKKSYKL